MDLLPTLGLLAILVVKEAGVPIPVPGDLLVLGAGVAAAAAGPGALLLLAGILAAGFLGGSLQFALVKGTLREPLLRLLARFGVSRERLDPLAGWLQARGAPGVAVARATPGLRIGAIAASGMAALPFPAFLAGLVAGNSVFVGGHFALGFVVGPPAVEAIAGASLPLLLGGGLVVLAVLGAATWTALRRRRRRASSPADPRPADTLPAAARPAGTLPADLPSVGSWAEAACPACLGISVLRAAAAPGPPDG
jgi:membrane protein DedA with SNARE-associated domain